MALNLRARLGFDGKGFHAGMDKAKAKAKTAATTIGNSFKGMGAAMGAMVGAMGIGMLGSKINEAIDYGARIRDMATKFGLSTKEIQQFEYAMTQSGFSAEVATSAFSKMQVYLHRANSEFRGSMRRKELTAAFETLGVSAENLRNRRPMDVFLEIAKAMKGVDVESAQLSEALNTVFGGSGRDMMVAFQGGFAGLMAGAEDAGVVMEDEMIQRLGAASDKMAELKMQSMSTFGTMADSILFAAEAMGTLARAATEGATGAMSGMVAMYDQIAGLVTGGGMSNRGLAEFVGAIGPDAAAKPDYDALAREINNATDGFAELSGESLKELTTAADEAAEEIHKIKQQAFADEVEEAAKRLKEREKIEKDLATAEQKLEKIEFDRLSLAEQEAALQKKLNDAKADRAQAEADLAAKAKAPAELTAAQKELELAAADFKDKSGRIGNVAGFQGLLTQARMAEELEVGGGAGKRTATARSLAQSMTALEVAGGAGTSVDAKKGMEEYTASLVALGQAQTPAEREKALADVKKNEQWLAGLTKKHGAIFDQFMQDYIAKEMATRLVSGHHLKDGLRAAAKDELEIFEARFGGDAVGQAKAANQRLVAARAKAAEEEAKIVQTVEAARMKLEKAEKGGDRKAIATAEKGLADEEAKLAAIKAGSKNEELALAEAKATELALEDELKSKSEAVAKEAKTAADKAAAGALPIARGGQLARIGLTRGGKSPEITLGEKQLATLKDLLTQMEANNRNTSVLNPNA